ncbi:MAG: site-specific integrase [Lachnospiraceae bacterium]|nr:site-specific integrase [Lachnospiraceae bacterium]
MLKRTDVESRYTVSSFKKEMKGIYSSCISKDTLDEAPFAYRSLDEIEGQIADQTYIVNANVRLDEFLEYWLEYDIRQRVGSSNTYATFKNIAIRHITPILGKKKLVEINAGDIQRLYQNRVEYSKNIAALTKTVMNVSMRYAVECRLLAVNPADGIPLPKMVKSQPYHTRNIDTSHTLTMEQIQLLLDASKETPIHMQVCFNVLMGLRRSEIIGVKYADVDYINRTLSVERQLGKALNREPYAMEEHASSKSELRLKTSPSRRILPIPDYVFEAILAQRKQYEKNRSRRGQWFLDADYICCSNYGKPRRKDFHWKYYKELLNQLGLPDIRWHDLRSSYCTLLLKNEFNPKAVSNLMGHAKEIITMDVYGDNSHIIDAEIPELDIYMNEVMPESEKEGGSGEEETLETVIDVDEYLPESDSIGQKEESKKMNDIP